MSQPAREQWGTRAGFLLAAIGSAIGLGNIWRFPAVAYDNGGGAFFLPYVFALLTAGIPLLALEYAIGHRFRGSAPLAFRRLHARAEWLGWWQIAISLVIASYYAVIVAWAGSYTVFAATEAWADDPEDFFFGSYLQQTAEAGALGGLVPAVVVPLVAVWAVVLIVLLRGVRRGIELANRIMIPTLVITFLVLVVRAVSLPGAAGGLDAFFRPDFAGLFEPAVWVAAYGQIFFSLSIAFAIMITYASYLPRRTDLTGSGMIAGFANASFELLAGIGVFAALGFMAATQGIAVDEVVADGIGLAFVVFPEILSTFPALQGLFGVLFFGSLLLAGLSSLISIVQTVVAAVGDKLGWPQRRAVLVTGLPLAAASLLYATRGGVAYLDVVDYFINGFGIAAAGLVEVVLIAWVLRTLDRLRRHADGVSDMRLGWWWTIALGVVTPVMLGYQLLENLRTAVLAGYGDYPVAFQAGAGWVVAAAVLVAGLALARQGWRADVLQLEDFTVEADRRFLKDAS